MSNWTKVDNDPPAVLRALADGKRVRRDSWDDEDWVRMDKGGRLREEDDSPHVTNGFSGTWFIEAPRDIMTDPQVGDEFVWDGDRAKVVAVIDGFVFFHDGAFPSACAMPEWASAFESGYRKHYKPNLKPRKKEKR